MCEQCSAKCIVWKTPVLPDYCLVRARQDGMIMKRGEFGLVQANDPDFVFRVKPTPCPLNGLSDQEINRLGTDSKEWKKFERWLEQVKSFRLSISNKSDFNLVHDLIRSCCKGGWQRGEECIYSWLFNRIGIFLSEQ